jgi:hypothetical protein
LSFSEKEDKVDSFPGNSHKAAQPADQGTEKKVEKVVIGKVVTRKQPLGRRVTSLLIGAEAKSSWMAVVQDVVVPAAKDMLTDAISQGVERLVYGEAKSRPRRGPILGGGFQSGYTSYNRFGGSTNTPVGRASGREEARPISRRARASHDFDEIILTTRTEAEAVLEQLYELLSRYEQVSVSDLYDLVGVSGEWTDEKYGWTNLSGSNITRVREGYLLNLPKPDVIN